MSSNQPMSGSKDMWTLIIVLVILWLLGFSFKVGGNLVHTLLVIALVIFIVQSLT